MDSGIYVAYNQIKTYDRWYYNFKTAICEKFAYFGDGGNSNNFLTRTHCESYCKNSKFLKFYFDNKGP